MSDNKSQYEQSDNKSMESVTTYGEDSLIGKVFPEILTEEGSVRSDDSSTSIDYDDIIVRFKEGILTATKQEKDEISAFLEEHKDKISLMSGNNEIGTEQLINEMEELLKENPVDSTVQNDGQGQDDVQGQDDGQGQDAIEVTLNAGQLKDAINEGVKNLIEDETNVQFTEDGLKISVQKDPAKSGGKSKKKQMKPKNKSNKKMKKKQTKKGGKQIKKRSLKRKMKK